MKEYLGSGVISLNSELLALVEKVANSFHPTSKVVFKPSQSAAVIQTLFLLTSSSPFLSILSLQQSPRIFDVLDSGGFWRVGLDQHPHVPHHLKIWEDKPRIWKNPAKGTSATLRPEVKDLRQGSNSFFTFAQESKNKKTKTFDKTCWCVLRHILVPPMRKLAERWFLRTWCPNPVTCDPRQYAFRFLRLLAFQHYAGL